MKKKILASLIISLSLVCNQVQASAASAVGDYIAEHPEKLSKAKDVLKFGFKHSKTALRLTGKAGLKTAEVVKDHPFLALTGVAAVTGIALLSVDNAVYQLARQPDTLDYYLDKNPEKIDKFVSKAVDKYYKNIDNSEGELYSNLLYKMGIDIVGITETYPNIIAKTKQDQEDLEKTKDFLFELAAVQKIADSYDNKNKISCDINDVKKIFSLTGKKFKSFSVSKGLPYNNDGLATPFNVDQFSELTASRNNIERDHIPSYKALELFFLRKNITNKDLLNKKKTKDGSARYIYLANNATSINLRYALHRENRTTGDRNKFFSLQDGIDSLSLRYATLKDYATLLVLTKNNPIEYNQLKLSFITLYERNKMLCLYDI